MHKGWSILVIPVGVRYIDRGCMPITNLTSSIITAKNRKAFICIALLVLISLIAYHRWLNFSIFANADHPFFFAETMRDWISPSVWSSTLWSSNSSFGSIDALLWKTPYNFLSGIFGSLGFGSQVEEKFLIMWLWIILPVVGGFLLVREVTKSSLAGCIGALVFSFNTYFLSGNTQGHLLLSLSAAFSVFAIWLFIKSIEEKSFLLSLLTNLPLFMAGFYDFRLLYITLWIFLFYGLYTIIQDFNWKRISSLAFFVFSPFLASILLNLHYFLPLFLLNLLKDGSFFARGLFGDQFWGIRYATTLFHPFWNGGDPEWFIVQPIPFYVWLIPVFAFLGLLFNRKNRKTLFFALISLMGILLTKQADRPFPNLYLWLYQNLPGFGAFREASKFYFLIAIGYAVLIGSFVNWLWSSHGRIKILPVVRLLLTTLIILIFLWNVSPLIAGKIGSLFVPRRMPDDYLIVKDFISKQPAYFRTLWVPRVSYWSFYNNSHPKVNSLELGALLNLGIADARLTDQERVARMLKQDAFRVGLNMGTIKYVFVYPHDEKNNIDSYIGKGYDPQVFSVFIDELDRLKYLSKQNIGTQKVVVYENKSFRPHIYTTYEKESLSKDIPFQKIDYKPISASEYRVSLKNLSNSIYLNFSETYHPDWKLKTGEFKWWEVLTKNDYFLSDKNHFQTEAGLNSFLIDPTETKRADLDRSTYIENPDGSIDLDLTLYFKPQSYFYLGLAISSVTLILLLGSLLFLSFRRHSIIVE